MSEEKNNLKLWDSVQETDLAHTKEAAIGAYKFTSISGTYMVMRATEIFGQIGEGWGYEIEEERYDEGIPIEFNKSVICNEVNHTLKIRLWYIKEDGTKAEVVNFGHTPYIFKTNYGAKSDQEAPKKSLTDAIKKCLSMLGFSADIFLGMFEDEAYKEEIAAKQAIEKADDADEERTRQRSGFVEWLEATLKSYDLLPNTPTLRMQHQDYMNKAGRKCSLLGTDYEPVKQKLIDAFSKRQEELTPEEELVCHNCGALQTGKLGDACDECNTQLTRQEQN